MATRQTLTEAQLKQALRDLTIASVVFATGDTRKPQRKELLAAIAKGNQALKADLAADAVPDPEQYVRNFINAGGNWTQFIAAVSRLSLEGATRKN